MLNLPVETSVKYIHKAFGLFGWFAILVATTYFYVKNGCPHTETVYSSSCSPYTYSAGLVPGTSIPPIYLYKPITLSGNTVACFMDRYIYTFQNYRGPGYSQTFRSELYCNQAYTGNASLVPSSSYEPVFNRTNYAKFAYVNSPKAVAHVMMAVIREPNQTNTASTSDISQAGCHYIQGDHDYDSCGLDYSNKTETTVNITLIMKEYFDGSKALMTVLNTETLFACERCRVQDITFRNFTAYLAGLSTYIGGFTTMFLILIGPCYVTGIIQLLKRGREEEGGEELSRLM
ncbi:hypothetical protein KI688_007294 [Linnemannia hyalina]|uniref:Uncharacterized protein n=1 Tax=Linnemannia hyalina TaxID=64524 RepID=A0A9P8BN06_9FUNG|nr:hypothetical protein KI688_007294 [Linnemannia hyalina]